jgi:hypothetical protein
MEFKDLVGIFAACLRAAVRALAGGAFLPRWLTLNQES